MFSGNCNCKSTNRMEKVTLLTVVLKRVTLIKMLKRLKPAASALKPIQKSHTRSTSNLKIHPKILKAPTRHQIEWVCINHSLARVRT